MPEICFRLCLRQEISMVQKGVRDQARKAKQRMKIPVQPSSTVAAFRDQLMAKMSDVGTSLLGVNINPIALNIKHFIEISRIALTLQASWREENDQGVKLLKMALAELGAKGHIKDLKYGGTPETAVQLEIAKALINQHLPNMGSSYLKAWMSDIEVGRFWTTDHLYDWLSMGKVCGGSCQDYDGSTYYNKALGGPFLALDKLAFLGNGKGKEDKNKLCRVLLVPAPVKIDDVLEWDLLLPRIYYENDYDDTPLIIGALEAAALAGCRRIGFLEGVDIDCMPDEELIVEINDRKERIILEEPEEDIECIIYALQIPNRYKYWDSADGLVDYKEEAEEVEIAGIKTRAVKMSSEGTFISLRREII